MAYIEHLPPFSKEVKKLKRKNPYLANDLVNLIMALETNPTMGERMGKGIY